MTLRDAPNLGFRIEERKDSHVGVRRQSHVVVSDGGFYRGATKEERILWEVLRRAETVAEAAAAEIGHYTTGDNKQCSRCGARRPWRRTLCETPLGDAVAVWREGKNG